MTLHPLKKPLPFLKKIKYGLEYASVRLIAAPLSFLSRKQSMAVGKVLGRVVGRLLNSRSKIARHNMMHSFQGISKEESDVLIRQCWENLGMGVAEFTKIISFSKEDIDSITELEGLERMQASYQAGKGTLIITGHYGAWEMGSKVWPNAGFRTAVVARRVKNPFVNDWVNHVRSYGGVRVILSREAVRESIRWLKQGNLLAILTDHRVAEGGLKIPFFGRPALTTSLPAILALRYSIPVHPVYSWREGEKVKIHIEEAMDFSDLTASEEGIMEATLRMNQVMENWVRKNPAAWLWIHNRWKINS